jgi:UDP-GlcNAc:undecaprenyl-phosphate GlcNAc-1-phosphate transferase
MYSLLWLALSSFVFSIVLTPLCRNAFRRWGLVDRPDGQRKLHRQPIPRIGGIPIALSCLASYALLVVSPLAAGAIINQNFSLVLKLLPAGALVLAVGLLDDLFGLKPWQKLAGQACASCIAFWAGVRIDGIAGHPLDIWWSFPLTLLWLIGCANAFNLIDGVDGLASGVGFFATLTMILAAFLQNNVPLAMATVPLAGALLAFLRYNFNPASIFLGDSGSLLIGFLLGCYGIIWSQKSATLLGMTAPLMALAIPLLDAGLAIVRRYFRHQPIFGADRGHIHHRLLDLGLTPRRVVLLLYGISGLFAAVALLQSVAPNRYAGVIIILFCAVTWIGVQNLGYVEFGAASRMLLAGAFRRLLNGHLCLRSFEQSLAAARNVHDFWAAIRETSKTLGFSEVRLQLRDEVYQDPGGASLQQGCWQLRVPLADVGYVNLTREFHSETLPMTVAPLVDIIQSQFQLKSAQFGLETSTLPVHAIPHLSMSNSAGRANGKAHRMMAG